MAIRLNLGCGNDVREGFINVDVLPRKPDVVPMDMRKMPWAFATGSVDEVLLLNCLEHKFPMDEIWHEVHRILRVGGRVTIEVVYGQSYDPFHDTIWKRRSIRALCNGYGTSRWDGHPAFRHVGQVTFRNNGGFPGWHIRKYLHVEPPAILNPGHRLMKFTLEKLA